MSSQPIFFTANPDRDDKFRLETRIWRKNGSLIAEKRASTPVAKQHLDNMLATYKTLSSLKPLAKTLRIAKATKAGQHVIFDYIQGDSAERLLLEAILENKQEEAVGIVDKLITVIHSLPTTTVSPVAHPNYKHVFGDTYKTNTDCTSIGLIDLNLDNFVVDPKHNWYLIDYEWVFDFPVAKRFLVQRFLWWFITRYQETFRYHAKRLRVVEIANNFFVPAILYEHCRPYLSGFNDIQIAENCFQAYVKGSDKALSETVSFYKQATKATAPAVGLARLMAHEQRAYDMKGHIIKIEARNTALQAKNKALMESKTYKLAAKLATIKNFLVK
jgi:hypothetical protein